MDRITKAFTRFLVSQSGLLSNTSWGILEQFVLSELVNSTDSIVNSLKFRKCWNDRNRESYCAAFEEFSEFEDSPFPSQINSDYGSEERNLLEYVLKVYNGIVDISAANQCCNENGQNYFVDPRVRQLSRTVSDKTL